ncbi:MAG: dihydropyrimidinase [Lachnospiraceae bacterium]|nr:dihydropyrimidinase [Lachnospiraceae bacterium]
MRIIVKDGMVVNSKEVIKKDLYIEDEKFCAPFCGEPDEIIDASGKYIFPGVIDVHTHIEQESDVDKTCDDYAEGTRAAVSGGTTSVIIFAVQKKGTLPMDIIRERMESAAKKAICDYSFHIQLTDINETVLSQLKEIVEMGITSVKIYMAGLGFVINQPNILKLLQMSKELGFVVEVHAESEELIESYRSKLVADGKTQMPYYAMSRPEICEVTAIGILDTFAEYVGCRIYIVHLTSRKGLEKIKKGSGFLIAETCPHYLTFDHTKYEEKDGSKNMMSPPLREQEDIDALWNGIADGSVKTVGSDHCPFYLSEKLEFKDDFRKVPLGTPGIETVLPVIYTKGVSEKRIPVTKIPEVLSENPARIFNIPGKGFIEEGYDADLVIFDPEEKYTLKRENVISTAGYSIYEGMEFTGKIEKTFVRGKAVYDRGKVTGAEGYGKFLPRGRMQ